MNAQTERNTFWECFDNYLHENGDKFIVTHKKGDKNQAAGNINNSSPMAMQTICCEFKYRDREILVQVYINKNEDLYERLYSQKDDLEKQLGYAVEWIDKGKRSNSVRRIQKKFFVNRPYREMIEIIYPYILDFIRVFSPQII